MAPIIRHAKVEALSYLFFLGLIAATFVL